MFWNDLSKPCSCGRAPSKQRSSWNVWHPERFKHSRVKVDSSTSWKATWFQQETLKQSIAALSWLLVFSWCCSILAFLRLAAGYTWIALLGALPPQRHRGSSPRVSLRNHTVSGWNKSEEKEKWYDHMIRLDIWCEMSFWNFLVLTCWTCKLSWAAFGQEFSVWQHQLIRYRFTPWISGSFPIQRSHWYNTEVWKRDVTTSPRHRRNSWESLWRSWLSGTCQVFGVFFSRRVRKLTGSRRSSKISGSRLVKHYQMI